MLIKHLGAIIFGCMTNGHGICQFLSQAIDIIILLIFLPPFLPYEPFNRYEALEEASRLYFGEHDIEGMFRVVEPLHRLVQKRGPDTIQEIEFVQVS